MANPTPPPRYIISLESSVPSLLNQQSRLLPLSRNVLCLPPLRWTPPPAPSKPLPPPPSPLGEKQMLDETKEPLKLDQLHESVLKLRHDYMDRVEQISAFLDGQRLVDDERRIAVLCGGIANAKTLAYNGIKSWLGREREDEAEELWRKMMADGVQGLLPHEHEEEQVPPRERSRKNSRSGNSASRRGSEGSTDQMHSGNARVGHGRKGSGESRKPGMSRRNSDGGLPTIQSRKSSHSDGVKHSEIIPGSPERNPSPFTTLSDKEFVPVRASVISAFEPIKESAVGVEMTKASVVHIRTKSRANIITKHSPLPTPPSIHSPSRDTSPSRESKGRDSAYSSGQGIGIGITNIDVDAPPTPPGTAEIRNSRGEIPDFQFSPRARRASIDSVSSKRSRSPSPTPSSQADVSGATIIPSPRYFNVPDYIREVEPIFPDIGENLVIHLSEEARVDEVLERYIEETTWDRRGTFHPALALGGGRQSIWNFNQDPRQSIYSRNGSLSRVLISSDKSAVDIQNEIRNLIAQYQPHLHVPKHEEAVSWILGGEEDDLWKPILPLPPIADQPAEEVPCPGIDQIILIGCEARNRRLSLDDSDQRASELAIMLSTAIEDIAPRSSSRLCLKKLIRSSISFLPQHPSLTLQDLAKGALLLPTLESHLATVSNPSLRVLIIDFELSTGSAAILALKHALPSSIVRTIVISDAASQLAPAPATAGLDTRKIYVRTSIGKTTTSFTSLPSPIVKTAKPPRHTAKTRLMAQSDFILAPWNGDKELYKAVECVKAAIRERQRALGRWEPEGRMSPPPPSTYAPLDGRTSRASCQSRQSMRSAPEESMRPKLSLRGNGTVSFDEDKLLPEPDMPRERKGSCGTIGAQSAPSNMMGHVRPRPRTSDGGEFRSAHHMHARGSSGNSGGGSPWQRQQVSYLEEDEETAEEDTTEDEALFEKPKRRGPSKAMRMLGLE